MSDPAEPLPLDPTKLVVATLSDAGRVRPENQDAAIALTNVSNERLLAVADGMGGQSGGETASKLCLDTLGRVFRDPHGTSEERLRRGLELANEEVYSHALSNPELKGMGTTVVALLLAAGERGVWLAWVGDSRCYRLRAGVLEALTRDHSLMAEWIGMGVIRAEEAVNHPRRGELLRAIGQAPDVNVETARIDALPGDRFLLCSDGIHSPIPDRALLTALASPSPDEAVRALIERANANGGPDNATAIVVDLPPEAFHEGAIEQLPEVALELELPSPPPPPEPAAPPPAQEAPVAAVSPPPPVTASEPEPEPEPMQQSEVFGMDLEPTSHSSAAIDAAIAELSIARSSAQSAPSFDDSDSSIPQIFESATPELEPPAAAAPEPDRAADLAAETSFADLMDDGPAELTPPEPVTVPAPHSPPRRAVTPPVARDPDFGAPPREPPSFDSPSLIASSPARAIQIPLMTPVRKRRGLHGASVLTGLAAGLLVVVLAGGAWLYLAPSHSEPRPTASLPSTPQRSEARTTPAPAPRLAPTPAPSPTPVPAPPAVQPVTPPAAPAPAVTVTPPTAPAPAPIAMPDSPHSAPTTIVIVRPPGPTPAVIVPAAPDGSAVTPPVPTAAGFELSPLVRRFVDDWLRAQETHDSVLFTSLGFRSLPTELAGSWTTRDGYRLVAAAIDEERSTPELTYLRIVVSYAFRDGTGRFRTEDEERMILRNQSGKLRFEGRWQQ